MVSNDTLSPKLNGLVLIGGRSQRMGSPKENIQWHGKEQRYYLIDLLQACCETVYISCRAEQAREMADSLELEQSYKLLPDNYPNIGPIGGMLTAFDLLPEQAWLVLACDLPLIDSAAIAYLIQHRDPLKIATAFANPQDMLPEPLFAIWEPSSYPILKEQVAQNRLSPRQVLIQQQAALIDSTVAEILTNVNTLGEASRMKAIIAGKSQDR
ncbi:NTP transferase domain-containing protein [Sphingobacterium sp. BIGb0165]|uniref:NTP transferase domain-containing protein n=1 Tax=Sphingobacterium sp. BIGb0165 TaxID=2940615 RepID=UPI0021673572|nr:NTP transferase domain-containing protein [Sphingobacterium sp. BIGb0165]MCS4226276.1 molybdopterin-guanine dinucleotide biosynthesis protein A [Sphingobacterium sp. BIGb0165]